MGSKGGRDFRNNYIGHMDRTEVGWNQGRDVVMWWGRGGVGGNSDNST